MNYENLRKKKEIYEQNRGRIPLLTDKSYQQAFAVEYTHNSTAIEGNTLTLIETKVVLEDRLSIGGKELREIYEVINHNDAFQHVKKCTAALLPLDENVVKDLHELLMRNIMVGGVYRNVDVYISGAQHTPPTPNEMYRQVKRFYDELPCKLDLNPIELAAWTHAELVRIHPFADGNGRTARLLMNYQLMSSGFVPISISKETRLAYFNALESYAVTANLQPFAEMVAELAEHRLDRYIILTEQV